MSKHGNDSLQSYDPEIYEIIQQEKKRQVTGLELIASEVCLNSIFKRNYLIVVF